MIRFLLISILGAALAGNVVALDLRAPKDGTPGVVITTDGRSLEGLLQFDPVAGDVRITKSGEASRQIPLETVSRVLYGQVWFTRTPRIANAGQSITTSPPAFVEIVVDGPVSLYITPTSQRRLLLSSRDGLIELRRTDEQGFDEFRQAYVSMDALELLRRRTDDCLVTQRNIDRVTFDVVSIEDHIRRYNACIDSDSYPYQGRFSNRKLRIRLSGGMSFQSAEQAGVTWDKMAVHSFEARGRSLPQLAMGFELHFPDDPLGRFIDLQVSGRRYSFTDRREMTSGCRWDLDCPNFTEGEYVFAVDESRLSITDLEVLARGHIKIYPSPFMPALGAGVAVQIPISRETTSTGTRTFRSFETGQVDSVPQVYDFYVGRYFLTSFVLSGRFSFDRFSIDVSTLRFDRPFIKLEEVAPKRTGYTNARFSLGITI